MAFKGTLALLVVVMTMSLVVSTALASQGQQQQQEQSKEDLRLFITGSSDSVIIGNMPMFVVSLFALLVGAVIVVSTAFGRGREAASYQTPSSSGTPLLAYDDVAAAISRLLERTTTQYEQEGAPSNTKRKGHHPPLDKRGVPSTTRTERGTI